MFKTQSVNYTAKTCSMYSIKKPCFCTAVFIIWSCCTKPALLFQVVFYIAMCRSTWAKEPGACILWDGLWHFRQHAWDNSFPSGSGVAPRSLVGNASSQRSIKGKVLQLSVICKAILARRTRHHNNSCIHNAIHMFQTREGKSFQGNLSLSRSNWRTVETLHLRTSSGQYYTDISVIRTSEAHAAYKF